ncbi:MAG: sialate O-acetylesterase [Methylobacter sp.]|jgi:hypothetical protein
MKKNRSFLFILALMIMLPIQEAYSVSSGVPTIALRSNAIFQGTQGVNGVASFYANWREEGGAPDYCTLTLVGSNPVVQYTGNNFAQCNFVDVPKGHYQLKLWKSSQVTDSSIVNVGDVIVMAGQSNNVSGLQPVDYIVPRPSSLGKVYVSDYSGQGSYQILDAADVSTDFLQTAGVAHVAAGIAMNLPYPVAFINISQGNTTVLQWANGLASRITYAVHEFRSPIVYWLQGESDAVAGTSKADYQTTLTAMVTSLATDWSGKWLISLDGAGSSAVRIAQDAVVTFNSNCEYGIDADGFTRGTPSDPTNLEFVGSNITALGSAMGANIMASGIL